MDDSIQKYKSDQAEKARVALEKIYGPNPYSKLQKLSVAKRKANKKFIHR